MSKRIEEILEVIDEVRKSYSLNKSLTKITEFRIEAVKRVAQRRGIALETVRDKLRRELQPEIVGTDDFDDLLQVWLKNGSTELRDVLLKHTVSVEDEERIKKAFESTSTLHTNWPRDEGMPGGRISKIPRKAGEPSMLYEGKTKEVKLTRYERDPKARARCIEYYGLSCLACGMNFGETYGKVAASIIHVHHLTPLARIGKEYKVEPIRDLRPVCPNCHAVIHSRNPPYSIEEIKAMLKHVE